MFENHVENTVKHWLDIALCPQIVVKKYIALCSRIVVNRYII